MVIMDNFTKEFVDREIAYLDKNSHAVDVETYIPNLAGAKKLGEIEYFNVILVSHNKIIQNNLFTNQDAAINNFVNLVCEYANAAISKEEAKKFIQFKFYRFLEGSVTISRPNIQNL